MAKYLDNNSDSQGLTIDQIHSKTLKNIEKLEEKFACFDDDENVRKYCLMIDEKIKKKIDMGSVEFSEKIVFGHCLNNYIKGGLGEEKGTHDFFFKKIKNLAEKLISHYRGEGYTCGYNLKGCNEILNGYLTKLVITLSWENRKEGDTAN